MEGVYTPPLGNELRSIFDHHYHSGRTDEARHISIGAQIQNARYDLCAANLEAYQVITTYKRDLKPNLESYIERQMNALDFDNRTTSATHLRVRLFRDLLDPLVCFPVLFSTYSPQESTSARRQLVEGEGLYGTIGNVLEHALAKFRWDTHAVENRDLIGFVNELTTLSLINQPQREGNVALPALPHEDQQYGIDVHTYLALNGQKQVRSAQVKSNERNMYRPVRGENIRLIGGIALGNSHLSTMWPKREFMQTAQAIVEELNGTITDDRAEILTHIAKDLTTAVRKNEDFVQEAA